MAKLTTTASYTLQLTPDEALFIKALVQNPHPSHSEQETALCEAIFDALPEFQELWKTSLKDQ